MSLSAEEASSLYKTIFQLELHSLLKTPELERFPLTSPEKRIIKNNNENMAEFAAQYYINNYGINLDDVSTVFADPDDIENLRGTTAAALSNRAIDIPGVAGDFSPGRQRGNSYNSDSYIMTGISLMYYFGDLNCPDISR